MLRRVHRGAPERLHPLDDRRQGRQQRERILDQVRDVVRRVDRLTAAGAHRQRFRGADLEREAEQRRAGKRGARENEQGGGGEQQRVNASSHQ
jgi:hypothetical protein